MSVYVLKFEDNELAYMRYLLDEDILVNREEKDRDRDKSKQRLNLNTSIARNIDRVSPSAKKDGWIR